MTIEVSAFDFDGCIFNHYYLASKKKDILDANKELFETINASKHQKICTISSNRQALIDDYSNAKADQRGSCFTAIRLIAQKLNAEPDYFLLSDIYNNLPPGSSYKNALACISPDTNDYISELLEKNKPFYNWIHDTSKLTVLYAQIHKIALEHDPDEPIIYNFYDDRSDILDNLHSYFSQYPDLIPKNVTLNIKGYRGPISKDGTPYDPLIINYPAIKGTRPKADSEYRQTVKNMAAVTLELTTKAGIDISSSSAPGKPITNYEQAESRGFDISAVDCIKYYKPGMIAEFPPKESAVREMPAAKEASTSRSGSTIKRGFRSLTDLFSKSSSKSDNTDKTKSEKDKTKHSPAISPRRSPTQSTSSTTSSSPSPNNSTRVSRSSSNSDNGPDSGLGSRISSSSGIIPIIQAPPAASTPEKTSFFAPKPRRSFVSQHRKSKGETDEPGIALEQISKRKDDSQEKDGSDKSEIKF